MLTFSTFQLLDILPQAAFVWFNIEFIEGVFQMFGISNNGTLHCITNTDVLHCIYMNTTLHCILISGALHRISIYSLL